MRSKFKNSTRDSSAGPEYVIPFDPALSDERVYQKKTAPNTATNNMINKKFWKKFFIPLEIGRRRKKHRAPMYI